MSNIKGRAFERGLGFLQASGAIFAVVYSGRYYASRDTKFALSAQGELFCEGLELKQPEKLRKPYPSIRKSWGYTGYTVGVKNLKVGEVWGYQCSTKEEALGLQKVASSCGFMVFGNGSCMSSVDPSFNFELLRVN